MFKHYSICIINLIFAPTFIKHGQIVQSLNRYKMYLHRLFIKKELNFDTQIKTMVNNSTLSHFYYFSIKFQLMRTQIIKINTIKSSLKDALGKVYKKFGKTNSEVTVIIKSAEVIHGNNYNARQKLGSNTFEEGDQNQQHLQTFSSKILSVKEQKQSKSQLACHSMKHLNFDQIGDDLNIVISKKEILPNVLITSREHKSKNKIREGVNDERNKNKSKNRIKSLKNTEDCTNNPIKPIAVLSGQRIQAIDLKDQHLKFKNSQQTIQKVKNECSPPQQLTIMDKLAQKQQQSQEEPQDDNEYSMNSNEQSSVVQSLFIVEDKLNDAVDYIKQNKLFQLEEYLYQFKTKYSYMSDRVQIKWRLLIAYCKQNRKQYERASILYQQVLQMAEVSPKSLLVDTADIYHRLGICFTQIKKWNEGIMAFSKALQQLQKNQKKLKYSECLNNLGALYLIANQLQQAQKCFLLSYQIKKEQHPSHSKKLISSLLNLFQCNLLMRNFLQADSVLKEIQIILRNIKDVDMLEAGLARRKGKLAFFKGDLDIAKSFYIKGIQLIQKKYPYSLQFGELCHNLAVIKMEQGQLGEARELLSTALTRLNFYYTKDSLAIQNMKSSLDLIERLVENQKNSNINNSDLFQLIEADHIKQN